MLLTLFTASGLYPLITKPTRITKDTATLIDNIFTNAIDKRTVNGILINDITDHFPIFSLCDYGVIKKHTDMHKCVRDHTTDNLKYFVQDLGRENWGDITSATNVNKAYDTFLSAFIKKYEKHCPLRKINKIHVNKEKPWITVGIKNACHKKNYLYKQFLKNRCNETEQCYKKYKNKLTTILRDAEKEYYRKLLEDQKQKCKETWNILNAIINKRSKDSTYPDCFEMNGRKFTNKNDIANGFNTFFANIGKELAAKIDPPLNGTSIHDYFDNKNTQSMFLSPVTEEEVVGIVRTCNSKTSTDSNGMSMAILKKTIQYITKPLTAIFNMSFESGIFPNSMKSSKIIPIFKSGSNVEFNNYRPISLLCQFSKILEKLYNKR